MVRLLVTSMMGTVSHRVLLLLILVVSSLAGAAVISIALVEEDTVASWVLLGLGAAAVAVSAIGAVATVRWLHPATRLPEHLRTPTRSGQDWRRNVVSLELEDGTRITCVVVRPGGYVTRRRTDPPFDARTVIAVVPATEADFDAERARQDGK